MDLQSFPQLIVIAIYERFLAQGQKWREKGSARAHRIYNSFSRSVKHMPILDLLGSTTMDVHDAIFDVGVEDDVYLFDESDGEDIPISISAPASGDPSSSGAIRTEFSRERALSPLRPETPTGMSADEPDQLRRTTSMSLSPRKDASRSRPRSMASPSASPRRRGGALPAIVPPSAAEVPPSARSPLGALFGRPRERVVSVTVAGVEGSVRRMEALVEDVRKMPVNKLKDEMKELQVRGVPVSAALMLMCLLSYRIVRRGSRTCCSC